jgi:tripartite-type tricarboxylate transporter receptor subunit TctC
VAAQTPEAFYKCRQLTMIVFSGAGSTYDIYARLLARHLGNHIPGKPTFIVQNMQGAGGLKVIDYLYKIAPKDGTVMGTIGRGLAFEPMLGKNEVRFDPLQFTWLGSMNREATLAIVVDRIDEAVDAGARLVAFGETFVPGYPEWIWGLRPGDDGDLSADINDRLVAQAVDLEADGLAVVRDGIDAAMRQFN